MQVVQICLPSAKNMRSCLLHLLLFGGKHTLFTFCCEHGYVAVIYSSCFFILSRSVSGVVICPCYDYHLELKCSRAQKLQDSKSQQDLRPWSCWGGKWCSSSCPQEALRGHRHRPYCQWPQPQCRWHQYQIGEGSFGTGAGTMGISTGIMEVEKHSVEVEPQKQKRLSHDLRVQAEEKEKDPHGQSWGVWHTHGRYWETVMCVKLGTS